MREEKQEQSYRLEELPTEDQRNLVGFFELLLTVDKRVNPQHYQIETK